MPSLAALLLMIFPIAMAFAAANDLFTMRIPNGIPIALLAGFIGLALITRMPLDVVGTNAAIACAVLAATFALFAFNLLGGGDAKLLAAGAIWVGSAHIGEYLVFITFFGGLLSLAFLAYRMMPMAALPLPPWALRLHTHRGPIPYGIAIAAGALVVLPKTELFLSLMA